QATAIRCADPAALPPSCEVPNPQVSSDHVGWAYLSFYSCGSYECERQTAWAWTTTGWSPTSLGRGWVYLSPYSGQWRWAWRQSTGWVAIYGGRLTKRETSSNWYPSAGCPQCQ
ncbi:MAG: hypothetical protein JWN72_16, partial [Thermoleophilia bacterium]|nr:hypothetical protein [Thermoleophilia bacterium]